MGKSVGSHIDEAAWLEERKTGIGGSEIAVLFDENPYKTQEDLRREKLGLNDPVEVTPAMERGSRLEDIIAEVYSEQTGRKLRRAPMRQMKEHPLVMATVDRLIVGERGCVELKCPGWHSFNEIQYEGLPPRWLLQGQQEALVYGRDFTSFGVFNADAWKLVFFDVEADAVIQSLIVERVEEWWDRHIIKGEPAPSGVDPIELPTIGVSVERREDDELLEHLTDQFLSGRELKSDAEGGMGLMKDAIASHLGALGTFETANARIHHKVRQGRRTFQAKALAAHRPLDRERVRELLESLPLSDATLDIDSTLEGMEIDLDQFYKVGGDYTTLDIRPIEKEDAA